MAGDYNLNATSQMWGNYLTGNSSTTISPTFWTSGTTPSLQGIASVAYNEDDAQFRRAGQREDPLDWLHGRIEEVVSLGRLVD